MYRFVCASPACRTRLTAETEDAVMARVAEHFAVEHRVARPSRSIVEFLRENTVTRVPS